jgi:uncharacterized protein
MTGYHHYKGDLPRSESIQRLVIQRIIDSKIADDQRENSKIWELKHCNTCLQIGRILALKRGLNTELAEVICVLHDIYAIDTGKYKNHAFLGSQIARTILEETKNFTQDEIDLICSAIAEHSNKHVYSKNPYYELIKDADVYDCLLYDGTANYYRQNKEPDVCKEYFRRMQNVSQELGVPLPENFIV